MIVKMLKVFVVGRSDDREKLLTALRDLGAVHLVPVSAVTGDEQISSARGQVERAIQLLSSYEPAGRADDELTPIEAAARTIQLDRETVELRNRLETLHRRIEHMELWGDVRLEQFEALRSAGIEVRFFELPAAKLGEVQADVVQVVRELSGREVLVAAAACGRAPEAPEDAKPVELPAADRPSLRAEAGRIDRRLHEANDEFAALARRLEDLRGEAERLRVEAEYSAARRGGMESGPLFALQGWAPADACGTLGNDLRARDLDAAVQTVEAGPDETPPTLVRPPAWARPIQALFRILGTVPGYREQDVSIPFMIAMPLFSAMLISDGGYGLIFLLPVLLIYRRMVAKMGRQMTHLIGIIGAASVAWGILTGSFFGLDPAKGLLGVDPLIPVNMTDASRNELMLISFVIGVVHLSLAQLWGAIVEFPSLKFLNRVGWAIFLWGMFGVVGMFVLSWPMGWDKPWPYLLIAGGALAILFASPDRNPLKMFGLGLANFPLSAMGTFSDIMSYVRLMAVGLAGSVLAVSFNNLAPQAGPVLMVPILILGHALNIGLCMIALFAHGVRLNVLEFSNNLGMQWTGYSYQPFSNRPQET